MHHSDLIAIASSLQADRDSERDLEGVVVAGSWDPKAATIQVVVGDSYAIASDGNGDQFMLITATVGTTYNDQYGAVGGERVHLQRVGAGWVAHFEHGDDDSMAAPAGERWIAHRNPTTGAINAYTKLTNDGPTTGDGLAGHVTLAGALHKASTTNGHSSVMDDTAKAITHTSSGGLVHQLNDVNQQITHVAGQVMTIVDGYGNAISHVVPTGGLVALGALASTLDATHGVINNSHLSTFESNLLAKRLDDLTKFATAMVGAGVPNAGAVIGLLASLVHVPVPAGSAKVLATS